MCGIAGFISESPRFSPDLLVRMRDTLSHRGPDACGWAGWNGSVKVEDIAGPISAGLAHRRLSIIDLSPLGHQPMSNEDGTVWIAFNGEIYNFQEFRAELESKGHCFRSRSDTETILHLYEEYGVEGLLQRINGMFAFAIWDVRKRQLVLARDRVGKKPLYYARLDDGSLLFASEMKALLESGLVERSRLDGVALDQIWTFGYPVGSRTVYAGIRQLGAGSYMTWEGGRIHEGRYWNVPFGHEPASERSLDDQADELESLLEDAVRIRLIADVPLGLFLSGGIDSSLIAAMGVKVAGKALRSFTIAFGDADYDESNHARAVAAHLGLENQVLRVDEDLYSHSQEIVRYFDEPFGDSSAVPTYFVAKLARQHVTVALSGDGGDELFAGYPWYREGLRLWGVPAQRAAFHRPLPVKERLRDLKLRLDGPVRGFTHIQKLLSEKRRQSLFSSEFRAAIPAGVSRAEREALFPGPARGGVLSSMQACDIQSYLVSDILVKVDRMSMAHALECRSPLLDYRVIEFAARLPYAARYDERGKGKRVLRQLLARHVPRELFERPKQGFSVPWHRWCTGGEAIKLAAAWRSAAAPVFDSEAADGLFPPDGSRQPDLTWLAFSTLSTLLREPCPDVVWS